MYVLDTSATIELINNSINGQKIASKINEEPAKITAPTFHELLAGASPKEEFTIKNLFRKDDILQFTAADAEISGKLSQKLMKKGNPINTVDFFIAGICISNNATLVTLDNDFKNIPELKILEI